MFHTKSIVKEKYILLVMLALGGTPLVCLSPICSFIHRVMFFKSSERARLNNSLVIWSDPFLNILNTCPSGKAPGQRGSSEVNSLPNPDMYYKTKEHFIQRSISYLIEKL